MTTEERGRRLRRGAEIVRELSPLRSRKQVARDLGITQQAVALIECWALDKVATKVLELARAGDPRWQLAKTLKRKAMNEQQMDADIQAKLERIRLQAEENRVTILARKRAARDRKRYQGGRWWLKRALVADEGRKELPASDRE